MNADDYDAMEFFKDEQIASLKKKLEDDENRLKLLMTDGITIKKEKDSYALFLPFYGIVAACFEFTSNNLESFKQAVDRAIEMKERGY
jgi:hypothetical protein